MHFVPLLACVIAIFSATFPHSHLIRLLAAIAMPLLSVYLHPYI